MAISQGYTTAKELRLHVKLTFTQGINNDLMAEARGEKKRAHGRRLSGGAAQTTPAAVQRGEAEARAVLKEIAENVAGWATAEYQERLGYNLSVSPRWNGGGWNFVVDGGGDAQKWARILEVGYGPQDTHNFIKMAKKKRALKVTKAGDTPGFYLIVPIHHGKVTQARNGVLTYTPKRDERLGVRISREGLNQFERKPLTPDVASTFSGKPEEHGVERNESDFFTGRYDPRASVETAEAGGKRFGHFVGAREVESGNAHWETDRFEKRARARGARVQVEVKSKKPIYLFGHDKDGVRFKNLDSYAMNRRANEGDVTFPSHVGGLRVTSLKADYPHLGEGDPARQRIVSRRGDVMSFITLSTRKRLEPRPGREGHFVMRRTAQLLDERIRLKIAEVKSSKMGPSRKAAYLNVLESALGRAL